MTKKILKYLIPIFALLLPFAALAQGGSVETGLNRLQGAGLFPSFNLFGSGSIVDLIANIIRILLLISGALAVLFVIIGGYQYITSAGNEERAEKGKKTLVNSIIGIVVIVLSYAIITAIVRTISRSI